MAASLKRALGESLRHFLHTPPAELVKQRLDRLQHFGKFEDTKSAGR